MKKFMVILMGIIFALSSCMMLVGCGGNSTKEGVLTVTYFKGGYGDEWLKDSLNNFFAEKHNITPAEAAKGGYYKLDPRDESIAGSQLQLLQSKNAPDIMMTQGGYEQYIEQNLIAPIDSVYTTNIQTSSGVKTVKDYMLPTAYQSVTRQVKYGVGDAHSWAVPWSAECFSLAYNEDILLATTHTASSYEVGTDVVVGSKWTRAPKTVDELLAYLVDVNAKNTAEQTSIIPFGWTYTNTQHLSFIVNVWWAQIQGTDTAKINGEGTYYDFFNFNDINLFDQTGLQKGLDTLRSIVVDKYGTSDATYINSDKYSNLTSLSLEQTYANALTGNCAVWVAGDYFENEFIKTNSVSDTIKFMFVPQAKDTNGEWTSEKITYARYDESFFVPTKAKNIELAKEFLAFMCNESELLNYSKKCGGMRPFDYSPLALAPDYEWTEFQKSFFDIYNNADEVIVEYPKNVTDAKKIAPTYLYNKQVLHCYGLDATKSFGNMFSHGNITKTAKSIMGTVKTDNQNEFAKWQQRYSSYFLALGA